MKKKLLIITLLALLTVSVSFNLKTDNTWFVSFQDTNTRPTYNTFHHITEAQRLATGKGIKIGIIGKYFGFNKHKDLYAGGKDFSGNKEAFEDIAEHGLWMATTLKEIAPDVQIYALGARVNKRANEAKNIADAIDWAIKNNLDILTYSAEQFRPEDRELIDNAVQKAINHNIVTTFIHYDLKDNILPCGLFPKCPDVYSRKNDVNIFHFDYNLLLLSSYKNYLKAGRKTSKNIGAQPYFSHSSMSPVLAGIVAMMKELNNNLPPSEYKNILVKTSDNIEYNGYNITHVVNALSATNYVLKMNNAK